MKKLERLLKVTDLIMLDIKHIDDIEHKKLTSQSNIKILEFARYLSDIGFPVWIRHVVVPGITYNKDYLLRLGEFLATLKNIKALDVLPYHTMGVSKYNELGMKYPLDGIEPLDKEDARRARNTILLGISKAKNQ